MTTALDVIKAALRAIQALEAGEEPGAGEAQDALDGLNRMIHGWRNRGVNVDHVDLILTDDIKLDERHHEGLIYLLSVRLAPEYEMSITPEVASIASFSWRAIQAHYSIPNDLKVEGLEHMPSRRFGSNIV